MKELNINELYSLILECKNYLKSTDYQVLREFEEGVPVEKKVKTRRSRARARINEAQKLIKELEDEKKK
jgi:hypothetical protein